MEQSVFYVEEYEFDETYEFLVDIEEDQDSAVFSILQFSSRMYSIGCVSDYETNAKLKVYKQTIQGGWMMVDYIWTYDNSGATTLILDDLEAG